MKATVDHSGSSAVTSAELPEPLDRDVFMRTVIRHLAGCLEEIVGEHEAHALVSLVGQQMGDLINEDYRAALECNELDLQQVAEVLVDLKRRIHGDFRIESLDARRIVLTNTRCPFGDRVLDRPSLCMMTSNVFGRISADNLGYAKVCLHETIARGDGGCRVVVHLSRDAIAERDHGIEYERTEPLPPV